MSQEIRVRFQEDIQKIITYYAREYQLSYAEMCGSLKIINDHLSRDADLGVEGKEGEGWKV